LRRLGFVTARRKTIAALLVGGRYIVFEPRDARESKNLLDTGAVTPEELIALLRACRGSSDQYRETPHHAAPSIPVHQFKPVVRGVRWYIKVYFLEGTEALEPAVFVSVHRSGE
jgi:hypothetical protein